MRFGLPTLLCAVFFVGALMGLALAVREQLGSPLTVQGKAARLASFSLDAQRIAAVYDDGIRLWDRSFHQLSYHNLPGCSIVEPLADGKLLVFRSGDPFHPWAMDPETGDQLCQLEGGVLCISPDGRLILASVKSTELRVFNARFGTVTSAFAGHATPVLSAAFSPQGNRVVSASDSTAKIWDAESGMELIVLRGHAAAITRVEYSPDARRVLSIGLDGTGRLWDASTGEELLKLGSPTMPVDGAHFSADGGRIVAVSRQTNTLWDAQSGAAVRDLGAGAYHRRLRNGWVVERLCDGVRLLDPGSGETAYVGTGFPQNEILDIAPDGQMVLTGTNDVDVWARIPGTGNYERWRPGRKRLLAFAAVVAVSGALMFRSILRDRRTLWGRIVSIVPVKRPGEAREDKNDVRRA